jgi:tetratricopeptide (TPR) repeat protein
MYVVLAVIAIGIGVALYFVLAPGPRRWRAFSRAQKLLDSGAWQESLAIADSLRAGRLPEAWQARLRNLAGECHQRAVDQSLKGRQFEEALAHSRQATELLGLDENEQRNRVVEAMLAEVRRRFAEGTDVDSTRAVLEMIERTTRLGGGQPSEATFWQALCQIRTGHYDLALSLLTTCFEQVGKQVLDPALYLGILLHRLGRPQEALRYLAEANRIDASCPFITLQMGVSLIAAGGDSALALRALQRALSNRGLVMWQPPPGATSAQIVETANRAWVEAFPEARSYVRRLAMRYRYICPLLGGDLSIILRQGQLALAQAFYRQDRFQESADLYGKLLQDSPPTVLLLRGYGLSLARLGHHDQAYKHLRIALEQEDPKDPFTAGYLALCGALGKPTNPDDKPKNIVWSLRLLARYPLMGNAEWAGLIASVHSEARKVGVALGVEEQLLLCDSLASVQATDPRAALAYSHLAGTFPDAVRPVYAWLYARAATVHGITGPHDLDLFARTFQDSASARSFFTQHNWDLSQVEYAYLERCAQLAPGRFPEVLGPNYPERGEAFLLARSREQEASGAKDPARTSVEVLLKLAPSSTAAHDRLACLHYRRGDMDRAVELLDGWRKLAPADHWPLVRQAIIEQERGNAARRSEVIDRALNLTRGPLRASVAFLGATLALREGMKSRGQKKDGAGEDAESLAATQRLLQECLREQPDHVEALWRLAAVRSALGDREGLASQAQVMDRPAVTDARFHFLGAVCNLAAKEYRRVLELGERALTVSSPIVDGTPSQKPKAKSQNLDLDVESRFVMAWAHLRLGEVDAARTSLTKVASNDKSPSAMCARALLGQLNWQRGDHDESIRWWSMIDPATRSRWGLDEPLRQTVLVSGLTALQEERFEEAAERFRESGKLGLRDRRLGGLITLALVKAGQSLLYAQEQSALSHQLSARKAFTES